MHAHILTDSSVAHNKNNTYKQHTSYLSLSLSLSLSPTLHHAGFGSESGHYFHVISCL